MVKQNEHMEARRAALGSPSGNAAVINGKQYTQAAWDKIATGYDEFVTPSHMWLRDVGLRRAGLDAGMHFVDVASELPRRRDAPPLSARAPFDAGCRPR